MPQWLHPGMVLIIGAFAAPFLRGAARQIYLMLLTIGALAVMMGLTEGVYGVVHILHEEVVFTRVDKLSLLFGYIFTVATLIATIYSLNEKSGWHHAASLVYAGSAIGVVFSGDFVTLFVFWEFMAFSSVFLILLRRQEDSYNAAYRYILVHVFGGLCLVAGFKLLFMETHSIEFTKIGIDSVGGILVLIGFLVNAAALPFNAWLPDSYPRATIGGAVFLSAFTTKSAVYTLIRGFAGTDVLIWVGVIMAVYGVIYAMMENDIRRVMAYSIISQVGYMVAGIGVGSAIAINGVAAHAVSHILYKGLLFMATGSVLYVTGTSKMTELGGLRERMPLTFTAYMVGALSISAVPFFSGFVTKPLIFDAVAKKHLVYPYLLLLLAATGTFLYTALKIPYLVFFGEDKPVTSKAQDPPANMSIAMTIGALLCLLLGLLPGFLYGLLPYPMDYHPYTADHIVSTLSLLGFATLGFVFLKNRLVRTPGINIDTDIFYIYGGRALLWIARRIFAAADDFVSGLYQRVFLNCGWRVAVRSWKFDAGVIDGIVNGVANFFVGLGEALRRFQTGRLQDYALSILIGLFVILNLFFLLF